LCDPLPNPGEVTLLLRDWQSGDHSAESKLFELLLPDLRKIAGAHFRRERQGHTLQPTALVNEAFLRLAAARNIDYHDRGHFLAIAARIMRRYLIDHARERPGAEIVPTVDFPEHIRNRRSQLEWAIAIDLLLDQMGRTHPMQRTVVELKFYLGFTDSEAAETLNLPLRSLQREWFLARRWLFERLNENQ
jgi:RNA polymerase sigma-70 factor (ECF subfamily)